MSAVHVATTRFGDLDIDPARIVEFDEGLLGFPDARRFALLDANDDGDLYWLQSLDDGGLAFLATVPWTWFTEYEPDIPEPDREQLALESADDASVLCLLTVDREQHVMRANLLGPVVVNVRTRRARQVVLHDGRWPIAALLGEPLC